MSRWVRNTLADVLVVAALMLVGFWVLRGIVGLVTALVGLAILGAVVVGLLVLAGKVRRGGGGGPV
ncbi:MAG: hypothetical protein M3349_03565 [Actinomycetota bacterium]|nr:hypothetical protein [Actinomycetota bacterium]